MKKLYKNWWVHNLVAHPAMQFIQIFNGELADKLHDSTLPEADEIEEL